MRCKEIGSLTGGKWDKMYDQSRRVYDTNGLCPTLHTFGGVIRKLRWQLWTKNKPTVFAN